MYNNKHDYISKVYTFFTILVILFKIFIDIKYYILNLCTKFKRFSSNTFYLFQMCTEVIYSHEHLNRGMKK